MNVFPHLVEMHHKYQKQGLVVVSVSTNEIDKTDEERTPDKVMNEVKKYVALRKAPFETLILDEPPDVLKNRLHFEIAPAVFIFNRQGKWVQFVPQEETPPDKGLKIYNARIEKKVVELLNEK